MSDDPRNLTGVWYGRYDALSYAETNTFLAHLVDDQGALSGTITEPDTGGGDDMRRAFVSGSRSGSRLQFVKQYDGRAFAHSVHYQGEVNADATEVSGVWMIRTWHGVFTMRREKFSATDLEREEELEVAGPQDAVFIP